MEESKRKLQKAREDLKKAQKEFEFHSKIERENMQNIIHEQVHKKLEEELAKKEKMLRAQLRNEFGEKLSKRIQEHDLEIKKKKEKLEEEMQKRVRQVLS